MKKKTIAALLTLSLGVTAVMPAMVMAEENTAVEENAEAEEDYITVGTDTENAKEIILTNNTGKEINGIEMKLKDDAEYTAKDALLVNEETEEYDYIEVDETVYFLFDYEALLPEVTEAAEAPAEETEEAAPVLYTVRLIFDDETTVELHDVDFDAFDKVSVELEGEVAYIIYTDKDNNEVNTLEAEKALAAAAAPAQEASAPAETYTEDYTEDYSGDDYSYDDSYYEDDYSYDDGGYDDGGYDDGGYDDGGSDEGGTGSEGCLDDGVLF